jgi:HSP20 family protein
MAKEEKKELTSYCSSRDISALEQMDRLFEDFFGRRFRPWWPSVRWPEIKWPTEVEVHPSADIFENKDEIIVKTELPGMAKEDVNVNITENTITLSGEKKKEEKVEKKDTIVLKDHMAPSLDRLACQPMSRLRKLRLPLRMVSLK